VGHLPLPDWTLDSGLLRAEQTADIFSEVFTTADRRKLSSLRPGSSSMDLLRDLQSFKSKDVIFLFGHEPDMGRHASYFLAGQAKSFCPFKKAGFYGWNLKMNLKVEREY
jgi:phosphohistidine phosphatase SixA